MNKTRIVVLGLGNPVLGDDMAGLRVAEALERLLNGAPLPNVTVRMSTRAGFELIDLLHDFDCALIVDAIEAAEPHAGRVRRLDMSDFAGSARLVGQHDISLSTAFQLARQSGIAMPEQVEIYAIEVADVRTLSEAMSPAVSASVDLLALSLLRRLQEILYGPV